jgi:hypothetical protein
MRALDWIGSRTAQAIPILASAMALGPNAQASLLFNFSVTPSSIGVGGTATLDLQITSGPPKFGGGASPDCVTAAELTFNSGDGQSFHLLSNLGSDDNQHQFTYTTGGVFAPEVTGSVSGAEFTATIAIPYSQSVDLTSSVRVNPVMAAVPAPSTWAMMILGFVGLGFMTYRRKATPALMAA